MHIYIVPVEKLFQKNAHKESALGAKAYMRHQFEFYGLKAEVRRNITNEYMKAILPAYKDLPSIVKELWNLPQREYQYFAIELIAAFKKQWDQEIINLIEYILLHKSWWDTVDHIASDLLGPYFILFPQQTIKITGRWNKSDNCWLQRSSIMFQKKYKLNTNTDLLSKYILRHTKSTEFFIQKAIGWALREYGKANPQWVLEFVQQNSMAPLSKREAIRAISKN